jgi:hypothetical protein
LYILQGHWQKKFLELTCKALRDTVNEAFSIIDRHAAFTAFLILPGLFSAFLLLRHKGIEAEPPINFLDRLAAADGDAFFAEVRRVKDALGPPSVNAADDETPASLAERADKRFKLGRLSNALSLIEQIHRHEEAADAGDAYVAPPRLTREQVAEKAAELFPAAPDDDEELPDLVDDGIEQQIRQRPLSVSLEDIRVGLARSKPTSANGPTGWTFNLIQILLRDGAGGAALAAEAFTLVQRLFQISVDGALPPALVRTWGASKLCLIPKPDSLDVRPICIGDSWYRLLGRVVLRLTSSTIGSRLLPLQLGLHVPGACDIGSRLAQALYDDDGSSVNLFGHSLAEYSFTPGVLNLDIKNAFNTLPRRHIIKSLLNQEKYGALNLLPLFNSFYGGVSDLVDARGNFVGHCSTGVKQGCTMGMLFFCLGFHPLLEQISTIIDDVHNELHEPLNLPPPTKPLTLAYADDCGSGADVRVLSRALPDIRTAVDAYGMRLNLNKSKLITRMAPEQLARSGGAHGAKVVECADFLGVPVGRSSSVERQVSDRLSSMTSVVDTLLKWTQPQAAYTLLRVCINARPQYLSRIIEVHHEWFYKALRGFDARMNCAYAKLLRIGPANALGVNGALLTDDLLHDGPLIDGPLSHVQLQRGLPFSLGGGGMPVHSSLAALSQVASRTLVTSFLETHKLPRLLHIARSKT